MPTFKAPPTAGGSQGVTATITPFNRLISAIWCKVASSSGGGGSGQIFPTGRK